MGKKYKISNLISNNSNYSPKLVDPDLVNAWDLKIIDNKLWVSANGSGKLIQYLLGDQIQKNIMAEFPEGEAPTGIVLNPEVGVGSVTLYIVTEQGKLYAYNPSLLHPIVLVVDNSGTGDSYKGLTRFQNMFYTADFHNKRIVVFDKLQDFAMVNLSFIDLDTDNPLPSNYSPFNIVCDGSQYLYVLYAEKNPDEDEEVVGPGKGYVDVYTLAGTFVKRLVSGGNLNAPWGLTFKEKHDKLSLLIGNFGDGKINEYTENGELIGTLQNHKHTDRQIDGLWGLLSDHDSIYFASGPNDENDGLVGKLFKK